MKHLPWVAPTVAILAVGSGFLDRINISFDGDQDTAAQVAPVAPTENSAAAALAAVETTPAVQPAAQPLAQPVTAPENVAQQLAALLDQSNAGLEGTEEVSVSRNIGFAVNTGQETQAVPEVAAPAAAPQAQPQAQPLGADFFNSAQANLARDRQCIDDLKSLSSQMRVYFPSGGITAEAGGIEQARLLGVLAQQCPGVTIQVEGHSDPSGNPAVNQRLSLERAEVVVARIASAGIDPALFTAVGRGDGTPSLVSGPQPRSYYDRRVEFSVIETVQQASFTTPSFTTPGTNFRVAACVSQLQAAVQGTSIEYAPRALTIGNGDLALATRLASIASNCPEARLRIVGLFNDDPRAAEDTSVGRLRAVVLMTRLVNEGFPADQLIIGAPSEPRPVAGKSNSRVDFDVILEDI
ncbi:Outer membrane porin F precursor [Pseudooctadecabacter jejudonensis]|uniref:Outer membrane porin F n=2 Tax=Pseudooctadecabacter jejudonensis TaxID=1391910 RepID=A0A1Y5RK85_9RHOB|nr:Outer membrane porin F precursor [Pseudooctadecabacter jejudonensis]